MWRSTFKLEYYLLVSIRGNLYDISLAIMATLFVLFGPGINAWVQKSISGLNFVLRTLIFVLVCAIGYGLAAIGPVVP